MLRFIFILYLFFSTNFAIGQKLSSINLDLNSNGEIYDVVYNPTRKVYIVIGSFTTIAGQPAANGLAFFNDNFNFIQFTSSYVFTGTPLLSAETSGTSIYFGGSFPQVQISPGIFSGNLGNSKFNIASVSPTLVTLAPVSWVSDITAIITDLKISSNKLLMTDDNGSFYTLPLTGGLSTLDMFTPNSYASTGSILPKISKFGVETFVSGGSTPGTYSQTGFKQYNSSYVWNTNVYENDETSPRNTGFDHTIIDSLLLVEHSDIGSNSLRVASRPTLHCIDLINKTDYTSYFTDNIIQDFYSLESYQSKLFTLSTLGYNNLTQAPRLISYKIKKIVNDSVPITIGSTIYQPADSIVFEPYKTIPFTWNTVLAEALGNSFGIDPYLTQGLIVVNNYLILSKSKLTNVNGVAKIGAAVFCLEPEDPKPMNNLWYQTALFPLPQPYQLDTTLCEGNIKRFSIPNSKFANGTRWTYSGTGLSYTTATPTPSTVWISPTTFDEKLTSTISNGGLNPSNLAGSAIWVRCEPGFTAGDLTATPFSFCNGTTDTLYTKPMLQHISLAPSPQISVPTSLDFNCLVDTLVLNGSNNMNYTVSWTYNGIPYNNLDSITYSGTTSNAIATVTEPINGCVTNGYTSISEHIEQPILSISQNPNPINCYTNTADLSIQLTNSTGHNPTSGWINGIDTLANPLTILDFSNSAYTYFATFLDNGCTASSTYSIVTDIINPTVDVSTFLGPILNELTCSNPDDTYTLNSCSTCLSSWILQDGTTLPNSISVDQNNFATYFAPYLNDPTNVLATGITINTLNGCKDTIVKFLPFNFTKPTVMHYAGDTTVNCSFPQIDLIHLAYSSPFTSGWIAGGINSWNDTLYAGVGPHVFEVKDATNGCSSFDTVLVIATNELNFNSSDDTLVCKNVPFSVNSSAIGTGPFSYSWESNGLTITPNGVGGIDSVLIVTATNTAGCIGKDTIQITIPDDVSFHYTSFQACGTTGGTVVIQSIVGGSGGPYSQLFNGVSSNLGESISLADVNEHPIQISDGLGCAYAKTIQLSGEASFPVTDFLGATYNAAGDTLILINTTITQSVDHYNWILPNELTLLNDDADSVLVTTTQLGWFPIQLDAIEYFDANKTDSCTYTSKKSIYFGPYAPNFMDSLLQQGINNLSVSPNPLTAAPYLFTATFNLGVNQNYRCFVTNTLGQVIPGMEFIGEGNSANFTMEFPFTPSSGTYVLHIVAEYDAKQSKIIVSQ